MKKIISVMITLLCFFNVFPTATASSADTTAPKITAVSMRNVGADVSTGDTVYVDVTVEDESLITSVQIAFSNGSTSFNDNHFAYDAENKIVTFKFNISSSMAASRWQIEEIAVCDAYGNDTVERADQTQFNFSDLYFNVIGSSADTTAPKITAVSMRNVGADVSTGDTVYVDVTVEDESAITSALISFTNGSATATSPNFTYDAENKIVTFKFKITDNMAASRWEINSIAVCDAYDNDTVERAKRTQFNFSDLYFNVIASSADTTAPKITAVSMRNVGADVSTGNTVYVDVTVEDESAITSALISFTNGSATATSPNFTYDAENKIVTFKFKITDNMAASRWEINSIAVCDAYDNDTVEWADQTQFNFSDLYFNVVVKSHSHIWADKWVNDNEYHWHICKNENCNEISGKEPHRWDNGVTTKSPTYVLEGEITYTCTDCGAIKRVTLDKLHSSGHSSNITTNDQIFADIPVNAYYAKAVEWAVKNGITNGKDNGLFGSNDPCTRGQIVTFLWRAVGSPAPKGTSTVPSDVLPGSYCYDAVAWALENGITNGFVDGTFGANNTCTRGQSVTFLYRALGTTPNTVNSFADVAANSFCTDAVAWAVENGVTNGTSATTFSPVDGCTRAQIVTFLYRAYQRV